MLVYNLVLNEILKEKYVFVFSETREFFFFFIFFEIFVE
jgi:hypothetical protein